MLRYSYRTCSYDQCVIQHVRSVTYHLLLGAAQIRGVTVTGVQTNMAVCVLLLLVRIIEIVKC